MAPKKPPPKGGAGGDRPSGGNGLYQECDIPLWEVGDVNKEDWTGGRGGSIDVPPAQSDVDNLYKEPSMDPEPWTVTHLAPSNKGWKRPYLIFSPFKPVVVRTVVQDDPYEGDLPQIARDDDEAPREATRDEVIELYRTVKQLKNANPSPVKERVRRAGVSPKQRDARHHPPTPCYMQSFNSCLMVVHQMQRCVPRGAYLWELIYPQQVVANGVRQPQYNPYGKYAVKLFFKGAWRKVIIDDRLPTDVFGQSLLTVTEHKEIWPALLAKAVLQVLGPRDQNRLFTDPVWCLGCLLPGFIPQHLSTVSETPSILRNFDLSRKQTIPVEDILRDPHDDPQERPETIILIATAENMSAGRKGDLPKSVEEYREHGLHPEQLYLVKETRPLKHPPTTMVRVVSPFVDWKGEGSYNDKEVWTPEFEAEIGFSASDRLSNPNQWVDAWLMWEDFVTFFSSIVVLRSAASTRLYSEARVLRDRDIEVAREAGQKSIIKWMHCKVDTPSQILFAYSSPIGHLTTNSTAPPPVTGKIGRRQSLAALKQQQQQQAAEESQPQEPNGTPPTHIECTVTGYDWLSTVPYRHIATFRTRVEATDSLSLTVPPVEQGKSYKLEVSGLVPGAVFAVLSAKEIAWLDSQDELFQSALGVSMWTESGELPDHPAHDLTMWFKRLLTVKQPTKATFTLSTALPGEQPPAPVQDDPKKGKAKGKDPVPAAPPPLDAEALQRLKEEHASRRVDLQSWASMVLVNNDTGDRTYDTLGSIPPTQLEPNKGGYTLLGYAIPEEDYPRSGFRITAIAESTAFDRGVAQGFRDVQLRTGTYQVNGEGVLFRYIVVPQEVMVVTALLRVVSSKEVPFTFRILRNDELLWSASGTQTAHVSSAASGPEHSAVGPVLLDNITLLPPEKGQQVRYFIEALLLPHFAATLQHKTHERVVQKTVEQTERQKERLLARRERLLANPDAQDEVGTPPETAEDANGDEWEIRYNLQMACSTSKLTIEDDNSRRDRLLEIKQGWAKKEEGGKPDPKEKKGKQAQPAVDEQRANRAAEARNRYLANRSCIFIPKHVDVHGEGGEKSKRLITSPEEEPSLRSIEPAQMETRQPEAEEVAILGTSLLQSAVGQVEAVSTSDDGVTSYTVKCGNDEVVDGLIASDLILESPAEDPTAERSAEEIRQGDTVSIRSRLYLEVDGKRYKVCSNEPREKRLERVAQDMEEWKGVAAEQQKERQHEEGGLAALVESNMARLQKLKAKRVTTLDAHRQQREQYFAMLREKGLLPKDTEPEPEDPKKKAKKK